jgi:hypothetical protein
MGVQHGSAERRKGRQCRPKEKTTNEGKRSIKNYD